MSNGQEPDNQAKPSTPEEQTLQQSPDDVAAAVDLSRRVGTQSDYAPKVPGYALEALLGEGAYGQVWRAVQIRTNKLVAVKVFIQRGGLDWIFLQREVERLTKLDRHPHIVTLLDTDLESEPPSYVMDLIGGGSLDQYADPKSLASQAEVVRWAEQICQALAYVHAKGLIHCDLKPANILVDGQNNVRVVDFGQSRVFTESAASLGTLYYMAPEQARLVGPGKPVQPDVRWDVYALGATLYAILVGSPPHASDESKQTLSQAEGLEDRLSRYRKLVDRDSDTLLPLAKRGVDRELSAVINKCIESDPDERYDAIAGVLADLEALKSKHPVSPLAKSRAYRVKKFVQRNPFRLALFAAALILLPTIYVARQEQSKKEAEEARGILAGFDYAPSDALAATMASFGRLREYLVVGCNEYLTSRSASLRALGALSGPLISPSAFWASADGGMLWEHGEWLALVNIDWPDEAGLLDALAAKAASGTDREKYIAFCLIGQLAGPDAPLQSGGGALAELCAEAVRTAQSPGVISAARWASGRLGREIAYEKGPSVFIDDVSRMSFMRIPASESFVRGADPNDRAQYDDEVRPESGTPIKSIYVSTTEVTLAAISPFVNSAGSSESMTEDTTPTALIVTATGNDARDKTRDAIKSRTMDENARIGVNYVSLDAAREYCAWLNTKTTERVYRLPTEDEWEYACRGGSARRFCFGDDAEYAPYFANCNAPMVENHVVAQKMPNWYGLFDMHGGLKEWCDSRYEPDLVEHPELRDAMLYAIRGGSYNNPAIRCRSSQRNYSTAGVVTHFRGIRLVMELETE